MFVCMYPCVSMSHVSVSLFRQCQAEELPFADSSVDLVTAMSAFHWFDRPRFLQEAHRILKAKGCLALLNYTMDMELDYGDCSHTLNTVCKEVWKLYKIEYKCIIQTHNVDHIHVCFFNICLF